MAADDWKIYDSFKEKMADGTLDLDGDTFKCALFTSVLVPAQTDDSYTALANEVANGNGYLTGGETLTTVTWVEAAGTVTFDADDISWTASGGSIVGRYAIIYDDTDAGKQLVAMSLLDNTPADVTVTDTNTLTLQLSASGVFTLSGGWT